MGTSAQQAKWIGEVAEIEAELKRVLDSKGFANSPRMSRFLRVIVEAALAGDVGAFKEYAIGCSVFDRDPSFDPRLDPVVRNEARRLRKKLELYFESKPAPSRIRITLPKGGYMPVFETVALPAVPVNDSPVASSTGTISFRTEFRTARTPLILVGLLACLLAIIFRRDTLNFRRHKTPPEAISAWKRGRHYVEQLGHPIEAMAELNKAIRIDPEFADAYGTLAAAYGMAALQKKVPMRDGMRQAKELSEWALRLNPNSAEGYLMLGAAEVFNRDWSRAEDLMRHSLELRQNDAFALMTIADIALQPQGKLDEAANMLERATHIDPNNSEYWQTLITVRCEAREFALAQQDAQRAIESNPANETLKQALALALLWGGETGTAIRIAERVHVDDLSRKYWNMELATAQNRKDNARRIAQQLLVSPGLDDSDRAVFAAVLGDEEQVLALLNREEDNRTLHGVLSARLDNHFNAIRSHPAFQQLLRRMRLEH